MPLAEPDFCCSEEKAAQNIYRIVIVTIKLAAETSGFMTI